MADSDLQALLDPDYKLIRRSNYASTEPAALLTSYYCVGTSLGHGRSGWTDVTTLASDAAKDTAIRASLSIA